MDSTTHFYVIWNILWFVGSVHLISRFVFKEQSLPYSLLWISFIGYIAGSFVSRLIFY